MTAFVDTWRRAKSAAFDLRENSTARRTVRVDFDGVARDVYANANLSVYSAQTCNARCAFCVEELRPASRGTELALQRTVEKDDERWFAALERALDAVQPGLQPSVSVTGGEPSKDPRLPRLLRTLANRGARKRTVTTNGSGLLDVREGQRVVDWVAATGVMHLNVSRAHPDQAVNARLMRYADGPTADEMRAVVAAARAGGTQVRLSCVLVEGAIATLGDLLRYIDFARSIDVDRVIFRQLMKTDPRTVAANFVVRFSDRRRVALEPLLDQVSADARFVFVKQIVGYYYYVEVWRTGGVDVVFEEADLARLEDVKRGDPDVVHELVFHPDGKLASTWQPWDGVLLEPPRRRHRDVGPGRAGTRSDGLPRWANVAPMSTVTTDERRRSFDQMVELYARARPAPPPALFDALAAYVPPPAEVLEIGCGPGNASLPLLERGFRIHAVELGENLAAFARRRLAAFPFTVEVGKLEDAALEPASVDLVVCSSAFHWLDRERALRQVVKVLAPGGALALIWGSPRRTAEDDRVDEAIQAAYRAHAPEISRQAVDRMGSKVDEIGQAVRDTPELGDFEERLFPQTHLFDRQRYLDTLATFSDHATLPAEQRARLFEAIGAIIDGQFGGRVERHSTARLQLARRR